ncbi:MAG: cyclase family protein [Burkholderiaceae bacterium]|nr:cyclase family protein [Burkholderiaceae bacterium]
MSESQRRWKKRPPGSNWGEFGDDDQLGRLNLIDAAKVRQGVAEVREGLTFCLSLPLDHPGGNVLNPRRHPPRLRPTAHASVPRWMYEARRDTPGATDVINDDAALIHLQYSTQWDSFAHAGSLFDADDDGRAEPVFYNGFRGGVELPLADGEGEAMRSGVRNLGIENFAVHGVQGRGVLVDLNAHHGDERVAVGYDELMRIMDADGVSVEPGDMLLLHTGFGRRLLEWRRQPDPEAIHRICPVLDSRDARLLDWITESGIAALIADNYAVEDVSVGKGPGDCALMPLHEHCLFKLGIPLGEIWYLSELAGWLRAHSRSRFLLTAPPLRLPGAVGSPATPIATV